jgi:hypothetical protein
MRPGVVLTLVIVALALTGVAMFVLTEGANAMLFHADTAYLQALERNLISSGLALARQKVSAGLSTDEPFEPDIAALSVPDGRLLVRVLEVQSDQARVHIETSCRKGRRTLDTSRDFTILLRKPPRQI